MMISQIWTILLLHGPSISLMGNEREFLYVNQPVATQAIIGSIWEEYSSCPIISIHSNLYYMILAYVYGRYIVLGAEVFGLGKLLGDVTTSVVSRGEHVQEIERFNRVLKERARCYFAMLP